MTLPILSSILHPVCYSEYALRLHQQAVCDRVAWPGPSADLSTKLSAVDENAKIDLIEKAMNVSTGMEKLALFVFPGHKKIV